MKKLTTGADLQSQKIANLADGTNPSDAVNLAQVQGFIRGLDWKNSVRAATTTAITLSAPQSVDGVAVIAGDRVLVKDQASTLTNGIYIVNAAAWIRATDFDDSTEVTAAAAIPIESGTVNGDAVFILTTDGAVTIGTTALTFTRLGGAGVTYTAGTNGGLILSGSAFSIALDTNSGLLLGVGGLKIDPAFTGLAKRYAVNASTTTTTTVTHNLGTLDVLVQVVIVATGEVVEADVTITGINTLTVTFAVAPTTGQYRIIVIG